MIIKGRQGLHDITIGVTGHRFLEEQDKLIAGIDAALAQMRAAHPGKTLTVLSALAEGADRLVAERVLQIPGSALIAVLPLPEVEYRQDFGTDASQAEFNTLMQHARQVLVLPPTATRDEAYAASGDYIIGHSDALIALWDGEGAQGQGGTGEVVQRALQRGIAVYHILTGNRIPGTQTATSLGERQGKLRILLPTTPIL